MTSNVMFNLSCFSCVGVIVQYFFSVHTELCTAKCLNFRTVGVVPYGMPFVSKIHLTVHET